MKKSAALNVQIQKFLKLDVGTFELESLISRILDFKNINIKNLPPATARLAYRRLPTSRNLKGNQSAFSIIEIILVIAVAGAIILVIGNLPGSINLIGKSNRESVAKQVAQQSIENVRSRTYANLANGTTSITDNRVTNLPGGTGTISIDDCPPTICTSAESTKKITITVSWTENSEPKSVILTTLVSDGGLK